MNMVEKFDKIDTRLLADRQREVNDKMRALMPPEVFESMGKAFQEDALRWKVLAAILGRDAYDTLWGVYRDTMEQAAEQMLTLKEKPKGPPSLF